MHHSVLAKLATSSIRVKEISVRVEDRAGLRDRQIDSSAGWVSTGIHFIALLHAGRDSSGSNML